MSQITTGAEVAAWLGLNPTEDAAEKYETVATVADEHIRAYIAVPTVDDVEVIPEAVKLAGTMYASRLAKRAETPAGMGTFGGEQAFYISKFDADIDALLSPYVVYGFA